MTASPPDSPLLVVVLDQFANHRSRTLRAVVEALNISEEAALTALERLEEGDLLVRTRGGTDTPVWKPRPGVDLTSC